MTEQKKQNLSDPKERKRFVTYKEATELYSMGLTRVQEHAKVAGATYKVGNKIMTTNCSRNCIDSKRKFGGLTFTSSIKMIWKLYLEYRILCRELSL